MSFDFNPTTNLTLRRLLLVIAMAAATVLAPLAVIEGTVAVASPEIFLPTLLALIFVVAVLPIVVAVLVRKSWKPLVRLYQPLALTVVAMVSNPYDLIVMLAGGYAWFYAHWLFGELKLWGTSPPNQGKPAKKPMSRGYTEDSDGNIRQITAPTNEAKPKRSKKKWSTRKEAR